MKVFSAGSPEEAVKALFGENITITDRRPVYGGDINDSYRLSLSDGSSIFMKCNAIKNFSFFEAEAKGLEALRSAGVIGVPEVLGMGRDAGRGRSFLLLSFLEKGTRISGYWEVFGRELALLHRADCLGFVMEERSLPSGETPFFGFASDNYIGASPQINTPVQGWVSFFRECRLLPQIRLAERSLGLRARRQCEKLLENLEAYLTEPEFPSLLHGDLWSGNAVCGPDGKAWILDPAVYVGHFEAELAMTELFGANPPSFYGAYHEITPIDSGYRDRRDLYNLYHMLNHLNLFGGSYRSSVQRILERYAG